MLTVDYGAVSSTARAVVDTGLAPMWANQLLLFLIAVVQVVKYFFPNIDRKK